MFDSVCELFGETICNALVDRHSSTLDVMFVLSFLDSYLSTRQDWSLYFSLDLKVLNALENHHFK